MSEVRIFINGNDAKSKWGVLATANTLSALLAPPPMKDYPSNQSRLEHGTRVDTSNPKVAQRELSLEIQMIADNETQFYARRDTFTAELTSGVFELYTSDRPNVVYRLIYSQCTQYTQFRRGIATLSLKVTEPNPTDRKPATSSTSTT